MEEFNIFQGTQAVLFDFDNTLVDFEANSRKALESVAQDIQNFLQDTGVSSLPLAYLKEKLLVISSKLDSEGVYDRNVWWSELMKELGVQSVDKEQLYEWTSLYWSIAGQNTPFEDALDIVEYLKKKGYKLGLVTNSDGEGGDKRSRISKFPYLDKFNLIIIGGENNVKPKPSLQPFIFACEELKVPKESCVMVGDDPVKDCLAAKRAGLKSILVDRKGAVKFPELYADFVVNSLKELEEFL
ncbi:MAG: HAD family hydrolase [Metallosphaera yellowstonensis]|jgi:haloacid dehalogenase superfamily, subfamily IA, variant 1 with third motif having Dx(3-4)D or Dx(3-4)E|uniref:Haloacid dehalogenase superfamily enzyme, subfamily IA n=1 Tax=Metallosphaera yellowstonensis MK1 TaxID=671065 RepID=H2C6K8_9CREN|nr:HAD family hydrolase [Metallosphaera yellowstonensis]EHP69435.1 haloacid dehalogenase superfamily enzyme, subfamily IA [Metallosphaera yellowstonensis MK1]